MTKLKKCIGIVSYLPNDSKHHRRLKRIERLDNLIKQINDIWPELDILIIAQNWQDHQIPKTANNIIIEHYDNPLTIVGAREVLRKKVIELAYDYVILIDDDAHIYIESQQVAQEYLAEIDKHPNMFCFIHSAKHWHQCDDYIQAPLNLCAISKYICEQEAIPQLYLEKNEALEDDIYAVLLHIKYANYEFMPPANIYCDHFTATQYLNDGTCWPSTWLNEKSNFRHIIQNTNLAINYIVKHKDLDIAKIKGNFLWKW